MDLARGSDQWDIAAEVIKTWIARHPLEWNDFTAAMAYRRYQLKDAKYATTETGASRHTMTFPEPAPWKNKKGRAVKDDLQTYLFGKPKKDGQRVEYVGGVIPGFWENTPRGQALRVEFARRFGQFRVPEKV